jgi:hypothetical protein
VKRLPSFCIAYRAKRKTTAGRRQMQELTREAVYLDTRALLMSGVPAAHASCTPAWCSAVRNTTTARPRRSAGVFFQSCRWATKLPLRPFPARERRGNSVQSSLVRGAAGIAYILGCSPPTMQRPTSINISRNTPQERRATPVGCGVEGRLERGVILRRSGIWSTLRVLEVRKARQLEPLLIFY